MAPRVRRRSPIGWSVAARQLFFDTLAATCNVSAAARAAGVDTCACYNLRRRDAGFAAAWGEALALGYDMVETRLLGGALAAMESEDERARRGGEELALRLMTTHRGDGKPKRGERKPPSIEEVDAALLKAIAASERKLGLAEHRSTPAGAGVKRKPRAGAADGGPSPG